ncbi:MAG: DoxX family protein [Pyrinomonadaceae bacterium]
MRIVKTAFKYLLALAFVLAGANHFINTAFYLSIMPPVLPAHLFLVYLSGVCEIALGIGLLIPKYSRFAAWGLVALLVAVFPANIYMALNTNLFPQFSPAAIWLRLPLQFVLIAWAFWYTRLELER